MRSYYEDKISMYVAVREYLNDTNATWSGVVAILNAKTDYDASIVAINNATQQQIIPITGAATDKSAAHTQAVEAGEVIAAIIFSYATDTNDNLLAESVDFSKGALQNMRDTLLIERLDDIIDKATDLLVPLADYGLTQPMIDDLEAKRDAFNALIPRPRIYISTRKNYTTALLPLIQATDKILKKRLDKLMKQFRSTNVTFYNTYLNVREIINTSGNNNNNDDDDNEENELTFSGTVTDNVTGALIGGATLEADGEFVDTTNALGEFTKTFTIDEPITVNLTVKKTGYHDTVTPQSFSPGIDETQDINMARKVLATYEQTLGGGIHNVGSFIANGTGLRIILLAGTAATVGLSNDGTSFTGNTETVDTIDEVIDRTLAELGGFAGQVLVQNNSAGDVEVKVEVLG
jgi:hypothetical protein